LIAEYDALRFIFNGYKLDLARTLASPRSLSDHFRTVSTTLGAAFMPSENALRLLSTLALGQDSAKALEFRTMATEFYPTSYRAWDQLGDLALARGDTTRARQAFKESVTRNPSGPVAKARLKQLGS
jgi:hypothetical protein